MIKKAIILAGGEGTRLRPITYEIPKPLVPVKKKPIINHIIDFFARGGINNMAIVISNKHQKDFEQWKKTLDKTVARKVKIFQETTPAGTFGCLRILKDWIGKDSFVVANGDCLVDFDFNMLDQLHQKNGSIVSAPLLMANTAGNYSLVEMDDIYIKNIKLAQVPALSALISGGPYIVEPKIFNYDDLSKSFLTMEKDIFPMLINDKKIIGLKIEKSRFFDCGTLENWERAIREWSFFRY